MSTDIVKKKQIDKLKGIVFPIFAIGLIIYIYLKIELRAFLLGYYPVITILDLNSFIPILISFLVFIVFALGLTQYLARTHYHFDQVPFINALKRRDYFALLFVYPLTLLFEELLFRGIISYYLNLFIISRLIGIISAGIFGLYHFHIFLTSKDIKLTLIYMLLSFILGFLLYSCLGFIGLIGCWLLHLILVTLIYFRWNSLQKHGMN